MCPLPLAESGTLPGGKGGLFFRFHEGQGKAYASEKRVVAIIAGGRSGKSSFAPIWLHREMERKGPGDYLVAGPNYPIIDKAAGPEIEALFQRTLRLGEMKRSPLQFVFSEAGCKKMWGKVPDRPARIIFGHADDPESLEAMSAKAAWLDEAGQGKFRLESWEAVQQRLSIDRGRCLITTKPYNLGWLKKRVYDEWEKAGRSHPDIDVINFASTMNPAFPKEELERARASLPGWKFRMSYMGLFERPAGLIYDCFDEATHVVSPFKVPRDWRRFGGLDFGGVNTAAVKAARASPSSPLHIYAEYLAGSRTASAHAEHLMAGEPGFELWVGGSKSEGQWRKEFLQAGLHVIEPPISDVEVGIQRVYTMLKTGRMTISSACERLIDELQSYSRVLDEGGEPTEKIEDKEKWHRLDALRYLCAKLCPDDGSAPKLEYHPDSYSEVSKAPAGVFLSDTDDRGRDW